MSLAIGLIIPTVVECGQKQAARSRNPELEFVALISVLISLSVAIALWFLNKPAPSQTDDKKKPFSETRTPVQFGIRHVLIATTLVAITFAIAPIFKLPHSVLSWIMVAVLVAILAWSFFQLAPVRSRMGAILVSLFFPFAWIVPTNVPFGHTSGLLPALLFGPGILPAVFLRRGHFDDSVWIAFLFVLLELGVGIWMARRGGK